MKMCELKTIRGEPSERSKAMYPSGQMEVEI